MVDRKNPYRFGGLSISNQNDDQVILDRNVWGLYAGQLSINAVFFRELDAR